MKIHSTGQKSLVIHRLIRIEQPCSNERSLDAGSKIRMTTKSFNNAGKLPNPILSSKAII